MFSGNLQLDCRRAVLFGDAGNMERGETTNGSLTAVWSTHTGDRASGMCPQAPPVMPEAEEDAVGF